MLKPEQIASVKGRGFLINRGTECFSGRLVCAGAVFTAADLRTISEIAEKFGSGKVTFTSRLSAEIVGIPFEQIDAACDYAAERGLYFGGTGAKIRPVTACKGTTASTATTTHRRSPKSCTKNTTSAGQMSNCRTSSKSASAAARTAA